MWKYVWVKNCLEIREMLFKNWKLLFENTNQIEKVYASAFFFFFFFLSVFLWLYATLVGPVHCSRDPQTSFFSNFDVKNRSHGTIHIFKNYFTIVFSIFNKKSGIQTHPYCKLKRKIQIIICFANISSIDFSKGLFLTPRYPNFCSSK